MFDMARFNPGGPTFYGDPRRLRADLYFTWSIISIIVTALTCLLVLIVILPIIKHRIASAFVAVNCLCTGVVISLCLLSPEWLQGRVVIQSPMNYYSPKQYSMSLGVHIGLASTNLTLKAVRIRTPLWAGDLRIRPENLTYPRREIFYNEEVQMFKPALLRLAMPKAIDRGLPMPLLTVVHFLTSATIGFGWSQDVMEAGYHTYWALVFALITWGLALLFVAAIPRYSAYAFIAIGVLMLAANVIYFYWVRIEHHFPTIYVAGQFIELEYGVCFWICLACGVWALCYGFCFAVFDIMYPDIFLTIFDIDYDNKRTMASAHRLNARPLRIEMEPNRSVRYQSRFEKKVERIPMIAT